MIFKAPYSYIPITRSLISVRSAGISLSNLFADGRHQHPDIPWDQMNGMRNILIHEYFGVDVVIVWHTAKRHLPPVKKSLEAILQDLENGF